MIRKKFGPFIYISNELCDFHATENNQSYATSCILVELFQNMFLAKTMMESKFPINPIPINAASIAKDVSDIVLCLF